MHFVTIQCELFSLQTKPAVSAWKTNWRPIENQKLPQQRHLHCVTPSHLHTQARTAHRKAGTYLADRARALEAEVETSRRSLTAALAPDRAEHSSSIHAFVLSSIGLGQCDDTAQGTGESERGETTEALARCQPQTSAGGLREAMMRAEVSSRSVPKLVVAMFCAHTKNPAAYPCACTKYASELPICAGWLAMSKTAT